MYEKFLLMRKAGIRTVAESPEYITPSELIFTDVLALKTFWLLICIPLTNNYICLTTKNTAYV